MKYFYLLVALLVTNTNLAAVESLEVYEGPKMMKPRTTPSRKPVSGSKVTRGHSHGYIGNQPYRAQYRASGNRVHIQGQVGNRPINITTRVPEAKDQD